MNDKIMKSVPVRMLIELSNKPPRNISHLSKKIDCTCSYITNEIKRLKESGFIYVKDVESSRREKRVLLTEKGFKVAKILRELKMVLEI